MYQENSCSVLVCRSSVLDSKSEKFELISCFIYALLDRWSVSITYKRPNKS